MCREQGCVRTFTSPLPFQPFIWKKEIKDRALWKAQRILAWTGLFPPGWSQPPAFTHSSFWELNTAQFCFTKHKQDTPEWCSSFGMAGASHTGSWINVGLLGHSLITFPGVWELLSLASLTTLCFSYHSLKDLLKVNSNHSVFAQIFNWLI